MNALPVTAASGAAIEGCRIEGWRVERLSAPLEPAFEAAVGRIDSVHLLLLRLHAGEGCGFGLAFGFDAGSIRAMAALMPALLEPLRGLHAVSPQAHWRRMRQQLALSGSGGPAAGAVCAVDMALWDLAGRLCGQPLWRLLGGARSEVAVYASGGSLALDTGALVREMQGHVADGLQSVKLKLGHGFDADLQRVRAVREALGPRVRIAVDANQQWTFKQALRHAQALQGLGLWWLEEPIDAEDLEGHAELRRQLAVDVASGESLWGVAQATRALQARAVDVFMPNVQRMGGITGWLQAAGAAELAGVPVAGHVFPELNMHLICAVPNGCVVEHWPGWPWIWRQPMPLRDGRIAPGERAGLGLEPHEERVAAWRVETLS